MLVKAAILMASIFVAGEALAGDTVKFAPVENGVITRPRPAPAREVFIAPAGFGQLSDNGDTGGPALHAQDLKRIAVYAAFGNRDGVEIASRQLQKFGVTREEVQDAVDRTHVHGDTTFAPSIRQSQTEFDSNATLKASY